MPVFLQAVRTTMANGKPLLTEEEANASARPSRRRCRRKMQAKAAAAPGKNKRRRGFLAKNKADKGVFTTPRACSTWCCARAPAASEAPPTASA